MSKKKLYLDLVLKDEIVEGRPEYTFFSRRSRTALLDVLQVLERASRDRRILGTVLTLENLVLGWGRLATLRRALVDFKRSGKPIYCFLEGAHNAEYYLASACDRIFISAANTLRLVGLSSEVFFFREVLDRFGVDPQLHAVGEYKILGEMFTSTRLSEQAAEQLNALLDDYYAEFCRALAETRDLSREEIAQLIDNGPYSAREAVQQGLLDEVCYQDEIPKKLEEKLGSHIYPVSAARYARGEGFLKRLITFRRPRIAIIHILGHIAHGESRRDRVGRHIAGTETTGKFLDHARDTRSIRAVVVRIDSPGGSGLASDLLWHKLARLKERKPVVVSFGDVAASGGYYISAPASCILAEPTSITGSIGVLGGKFVARELMSRLAVRRESIRRGAHAEFDSLFAPFSEGERRRLETQLEEFYREGFVKKVAAGRRLEEEAVDRAGRGRVWTGLRAREHGLVDKLGSLGEAIQEARQLAKIPDGKRIRLMHYFRRRRLQEIFIPEFAPHLYAELLPMAAPELIDIVSQLQKDTVLLLMPFQIRIR